jgi:hypothetical protein
MISWETCRKEFEPDGALRDIYVLDTTIEHWRLLYDALHSTYSLEYSVDGQPRSIPSTVDEVFSTWTTASPSLHFPIGGVVVACHFFCPEQIELDVDPREIGSSAAFDGLVGLLRLIGDSVNKRVIMSYESDEEHPFLIYEPSRREFEYHEISA